MEKSVKRSFNNIGEKIDISIQLDYRDMEVTELPLTCARCPVGFMYHDCGRNKELDFDKRADTCKLKLVNPIDCVYIDNESVRHFIFSNRNDLLGWKIDGQVFQPDELIPDILLNKYVSTWVINNNERCIEIITTIEGGEE